MPAVSDNARGALCGMRAADIGQHLKIVSRDAIAGVAFEVRRNLLTVMVNALKIASDTQVGASPVLLTR